MKRFQLIILVLLIGVSLLGCQNRPSESWTDEFNNTDYAVGAQRDKTVSVHEQGVFYVSWSEKLCYYDFDSDDTYYICSTPYCLHIGKNCVANSGNGATGFALYGNSAFYFRQKQDSMRWELVKINIKDQTLTVIAEIGDEGTNVNEWMITSIGDVYYSSGKAWVSLQLMYNPAEVTGWDDTGAQLIAIDLETGEVTELTEPMLFPAEYNYLAFNFIGSEYVAFWKRCTTVPYLNKLQYAQSIGKTSVTDFEYADYQQAFFSTPKDLCISYLVNTDTLEITSFREDKSELPEVKIYWMDGSRFVVGEYDDSEYEGERFFLVDEHWQEMDTELIIQNGGALGWNQGSIAFRLYGDDSILYLKYKDDDKCDVFKYSTETKVSTFLFEDIREVSFRIIGQTEDKLVGMIDRMTQYAWIYKSDYEKGNFDALHRFSLK